MAKKFDLEAAADLEIVGALAVGHRHRKRSLSSTKGPVRLSREQIQQVFDTAYGVARLIERLPRRSICTPSGNSLRLEKNKTGRRRTLKIHVE